MPYETDFDSAFTILLGKAQGTITTTPAPLPTPVPGQTTRVVTATFQLGADGVPLSIGDYAFVRLGLGGAATVVSWSMAAMTGGVPTASDVSVFVLVGSTLSTAVSITGTGPPELNAAIELNDQPPTGWTTTQIADPSWVEVDVATTDGTVEVISFNVRLLVG